MKEQNFHQRSFRRMPVPEVLELGNPFCHHDSFIDNMGLERCRLCRRMRRYHYLYYEDLIEANERPSQERGHLQSQLHLGTGRQAIKRHYGGLRL